MKLIVGLGNPGAQYDDTRHNIGFNAVTALADEIGISCFRNKFQGKVGEGSYRGEKAVILMPHTFMNLSGNSLIEAVKFYKLDPEKDVVVVYDDMDLEIGKIRIKEKGSSGGHNGVKSIIAHIGENFLRVKCGIGKPVSKEQVVNYVLSKFSKEERKEISSMLDITVEALKEIITTEKYDKVMQKYN